MRVHMIVAVAVSLAYGVGNPAYASEKNCAAAKIAASGQYMDDVLGCYAQATNNGVAARACLGNAEAKLVATFARLEQRAVCAATGDANATANRIADSAVNLLAMIGAPNARLCTKHKLDAMGQDAERQHDCYSESVAKGAGYSVDIACQQSATDDLLTQFAHAERQWDCAPDSADASTIDAAIRATVRATRAILSPPIAACAPIEVTTLHGTGFLGNSRLAQIENGQVGCVRVDDGAIATCAFSTSPGSESGDWLEAPQGHFAAVGQAISLTGVRGGEYIVAARVSDTSPAACIDPLRLDTAGLIAEGRELADVCTIEDPLMPYNVQGLFSYFPLVNWADREVCSADALHPDNAEPTRSYARSGSGPHDTFCYSGQGAALNDINGTERGWSTLYLDGEEYCHFLHMSGYEVPAAKRTAVRTYPFPGSLNTQSFIVWRPVSPTFTIANGDPAISIESFNDKTMFLAEAAATSATGPLPDLGPVGDATTVGSLTFSLAPGGELLAIGATGTGAAPDWYSLMDGNEIAMGYENLAVAMATPVYAVGFDFVEPNATMPAYGGTPVDSTFQVVLYAGDIEVGRVTFNAPDDEVTFFGVWSTRAFDRAVIVETTGNDDDEYFGQFYTGTIRKPGL